jgi:hypothetical protein
MDQHADTEVFPSSPPRLVHEPKPVSPSRHLVIAPSFTPDSQIEFSKWREGDFGGPATDRATPYGDKHPDGSPSPWGSPSPTPENFDRLLTPERFGRYATLDKDWITDTLATSANKVVLALTTRMRSRDAEVVEKMATRDEDMMEEISRIVATMRDSLTAELRALVVAKASAQDKEIRKLRNIVVSLAQRVDNGKAGPTPSPPKTGGEKRAQPAKGTREDIQRRIPTDAQVTAGPPKTSGTPRGAPTGPRAGPPRKPPSLKPGDAKILKKQPPPPSTIPDSQSMEGVVCDEQGLNASQHAPPLVPLPQSPPPPMVGNEAERTGNLEEGGLEDSEHAVKPGDITRIRPSYFSYWEERYLGYCLSFARRDVTARNA